MRLQMEKFAASRSPAASSFVRTRPNACLISLQLQSVSSGIFLSNLSRVSFSLFVSVKLKFGPKKDACSLLILLSLRQHLQCAIYIA